MTEPTTTAGAPPSPTAQATATIAASLLSTYLSYLTAGQNTFALPLVARDLTAAAWSVSLARALLTEAQRRQATTE